MSHLAPTLTDLDLSFAYMGFPGAQVCALFAPIRRKAIAHCDLFEQVLRSVLGDATCQLVRLGLAGNALGDAGLGVLSSGLKVKDGRPQAVSTQELH